MVEINNSIILKILLYIGLIFGTTKVIQAQQNLQIDSLNIRLITYEDVLDTMCDEISSHWVGYDVLDWGPYIYINGWLNNNSDYDVVILALANNGEQIVDLIKYDFSTSFTIDSVDYLTRSKHEWPDSFINYTNSKKVSYFDNEVEFYWLKPGQKIRFSSMSHFLYNSGLMPDDYTSWTTEKKISYAPYLATLSKKAFPSLSISINVDHSRNYEVFMKDIIKQSKQISKRVPNHIKRKIANGLQSVKDVNLFCINTTSLRDSTIFTVSKWTNSFPGTNDILLFGDNNIVYKSRAYVYIDILPAKKQSKNRLSVRFEL